MTNQKFSKGNKLMIGANIFEVVVTTAKHCGITDEASETVLMYEWDRIEEIATPVIEVVSNPKFEVAEIKVLTVTMVEDPGFAIGDKVKSVFGMFEGEVVALEPQNGRVICLSDRNDGKTERQRWAYKPSELRLKYSEKMQPLHAFRFGSSYKLHSTQPGVKSVDVKVCMHDQAGMVRLIDKQTGYTYSVCPKVMTKEQLRQGGIARIDQL